MSAALLTLTLFAFAPAQVDDLPPPLPGSEHEPPPPSLEVHDEDEGYETHDGDESDESDEGDDGDEGADEDGPGVMERYFPLTFNEDLEPVVQENLIFFVLGGVLGTAGGQIWLPALIMKRDPPKSYYSNAFFIWAAHYAINAVPLVLVPCMCIPYVNFVVMPIFAGLWFLNVFCCLANTYYLIPVALANEYDRLLKRDGGGSEDVRVEPRSRERAFAMAY